MELAVYGIVAVLFILVAIGGISKGLEEQKIRSHQLKKIKEEERAQREKEG